MDDAHLRAALRYAELNPVRARMVDHPCDYPWSSAAARTGGATDSTPETSLVDSQWTTADWPAYLGEAEAPQDTEAIRRCTHTGRPLGAADFVEGLEHATQRRVVPQKGGRPCCSSPASNDWRSPDGKRHPGLSVSTEFLCHRVWSRGCVLV
jgi:putative transposase